VTFTGPITGASSRKDALDVVIHDPELEGEITLLTDLIVAVAQASIPLDQDAIDAVLLSPSRTIP
jgi:hypothetical protein